MSALGTVQKNCFKKPLDMCFFISPDQICTKISVKCTEFNVAEEI